MQNEITELRTQVRTLKRIVYGFGGLLVAGIVVGATSLQFVPDEIYAKSFAVVNNEGEKVAGLFAGEGGGGMFMILNKEEKTVAILGTYDDGGGRLETFDNKGKSTAYLPFSSE